MNNIGKPRLMIVGCGDIGLRLVVLLHKKFRLFAVTKQSERGKQLRMAGATPIIADLDQPSNLARLARLAPYILYLVPPQFTGEKDQRSRALAAHLPGSTTLIYLSTTGVYGDCAGGFVEETHRVNPQSDRAKRRLDAEQTWLTWSRATGARLSILRVPGIYAADRLPVERLSKKTPVLQVQDDVYTNHIHAEDLARIIVLALMRGAACRIYHAVDDSNMKMGDYFDAVAKAFQLPVPPRLPRDELRQKISPLLFSFMSESRRLSNARIKYELGARLLYPRVLDALPFAVLETGRVDIMSTSAASPSSRFGASPRLAL